MTALAPPMGELEKQLRALVFDQGLSPAVAVDAVLPRVTLTVQQREFFLRRGVIDWTNNQLSAGRSGRDSGWEDTSAKSNGKLHARGLSAPEIRALLIRHQAADGSERALWEFSADDWAEHYERCKTQVHGWQQRAALDRDVIKALARAGVPTIAQLPIQQQQEFAKRIEEAWGG